MTPTFATTSEMQAAARAVRGTILDLSFTAKTPHIGSALSCTDILTAAY